MTLSETLARRSSDTTRCINKRWPVDRDTHTECGVPIPTTLPRSEADPGPRFLLSALVPSTHGMQCLIYSKLAMSTRKARRATMDRRTIETSVKSVKYVTEYCKPCTDRLYLSGNIHLEHRSCFIERRRVVSKIKMFRAARLGNSTYIQTSDTTARPRAAN